jgi:hypothetical protein
MIISASYKTDIPTFYGEWFIRRLRAGFCKMVSPYAKQTYRVDLGPDSVDGFVFWTKNVGPFFSRLKEVNARGFPFYVQYTINGYPQALETSVVNALRSVENMKRLAGHYGSKVNVWRYDTIIISSLTPTDFHRRNFESLAKALRGATEEVVVSFAQIYRKTLLNMNRAAKESDFSWDDPSYEAKKVLILELAQMAAACDMKLSVCAQPQFLAPGVCDAHCVDVARLCEISGRPVRARLHGNRPGCACFASKDIGEYDTCPHGCVYCYAVLNRRVAQQRYKKHNPASEFLFEPRGRLLDGKDRQEEKHPLQARLF